MDYYIDNYNFKGFGIYVQESSGVVDLPKFKPPTETDWAEYHGVIIDSDKTPRTEARKIQLKCFLKAENQVDFLTKLSAFQSVFMTKGLKRLAIILTNEVGLFFDVYMSDGLQVTKRWSDSTMVGQFTVNLCEPEPIKKIIRFDSQGSASTLSFKTSEAVSIYWGDGSAQQDLYGNVSLSHTYDEAGIYFAIIHGDIEELSEFSTNGEELGANNGGAIDIDVPEILQGALERVELYTTAESGVTQMTPYLKFSFNNNGETQILRITVTTENDWLAIIRGIERRLTTDEETISNNTEAISKNSEDIADLQGDIENINSDLQGHNTSITTNANNIQSINNKIGNANGIAELDSSGKVPQSQLPSYVDDVLEYASLANFPANGESGKIYVAIDTNKTYRWSGTTYSEISESLALGETSSSAYRGDRGKTAYNHSQTSGNPHNTQIGDIPNLQNTLNSKATEKTSFTEASTRTNIESGDTVTTIWGKIKKWFTDLKTVAITGSYNDLSDKLQNATTSSAGLMSSADKIFLNGLKDFGETLQVAVSDYNCLLFADITDFWNSPSTTTNLPAQGFCGFIIKLRTGGHIDTISACVTAMVSYQNNGDSRHQRLFSTDDEVKPHILRYDNKYYIGFNYDNNTQNFYNFLGKFLNCLGTPLIVLKSECTLIV